MIMNKKQQTDLTNGPIVQTLAKLALLLWLPPFWEQLQHHRYGMDRCSWFQGSGRCGNGGHVCMAFPGALLSGPHGRSGQCGPKLRTGRYKGSQGLRLCGPSAYLYFCLFVFCSVPDLYRAASGFFSSGRPADLCACGIYMKITCGLVIFSYLNYTLPEFIQLREIQKHRLSPI